ncbi:unnamed protein product [Mesocestoides corti]|nr:unnamed protein product [Mesocestoides corti]
MKPNDSPWSFVSTFFNFPCNQNFDDSVNALALTCLIWHSQASGNPDRSGCKIEHCPIVISVVLCALVNLCSRDVDKREAHLQFTSVEPLVMDELEKVGAAYGSEAIEEEQRLLYQALQLDAVYCQLASLHNLLSGLKVVGNSLQLTDANKSSLMPSYEIFPSLKASVLIARHLMCLTSQARLRSASRLWLKSFFLSPQVPQAVERLCNVASLFPQFFNFVAGTTISWKNPVMESVELPPVLNLLERKIRVASSQPECADPSIAPSLNAKSQEFYQMNNLPSTKSPIPSPLQIRDTENICQLSTKDSDKNIRAFQFEGPAPSITLDENTNVESLRIPSVASYPDYQSNSATRCFSALDDDTCSVASSYRSIPRPPPPANAFMKKSRGGKPSRYAARLAQRYGNKI